MNRLIKANLLVFILLLSLNTVNTLSLRLKSHYISATRNFNNLDKNSFIMYQLDPKQWRYEMIPFNSGESCFVRLSYNFTEELLLRFSDSITIINNINTQDDMFLIYVSSSNPLNVIDVFVKDDIFTSRICEEEHIDVWGIENSEKIIRKWGFDTEIFTELLNTPIALSSLTIGDQVKNYNKIYSDLWGITNFNSNSFDEQILYSESYINNDVSDPNFQNQIIEEITQPMQTEFDIFFRAGQIQKVKDLEGDDKNFYNDLINDVHNIISFLKKKLIFLLEDPTSKKIILQNRKESLERFNNKIGPLLQSSLFLPVALYKRGFSDRAINGGYSKWAFNEPETNSNNPKLMNQLILKTNFFSSITDFDHFLKTKSNTEFNVVLRESIDKISEAYEKWLQAKFTTDKKSIISAMNWFNSYTSEERMINSKLSFTNYNIIKKMDRYINSYLTKFFQNDYITMKSYYQNDSLNFDKIMTLFYETRTTDHQTLPIKIGVIFEIS